MTKRDIETALRRKGIRTTTLEYDRQPTPGGMVSGWTVILDEDHSEALMAHGYGDQPDDETYEGVMEWARGLPDVTPMVAAMSIMDDLRGRSGILDGLDDEIMQEIEEAIRGHIAKAYEGRI